MKVYKGKNKGRYVLKTVKSGPNKGKKYRVYLKTGQKAPATKKRVTKKAPAAKRAPAGKRVPAKKKATKEKKVKAPAAKKVAKPTKLAKKGIKGFEQYQASPNIPFAQQIPKDAYIAFFSVPGTKGWSYKYKVLPASAISSSDWKAANFYVEFEQHLVTDADKKKYELKWKTMNKLKKYIPSNVDTWYGLTVFAAKDFKPNVTPGDFHGFNFSKDPDFGFDSLDDFFVKSADTLHLVNPKREVNDLPQNLFWAIAYARGPEFARRYARAWHSEVTEEALEHVSDEELRLMDNPWHHFGKFVPKFVLDYYSAKSRSAFAKKIK